MKIGTAIVLARSLFSTHPFVEEVLLLLNNRTGDWELPGGKFETEDFLVINTARRELREETGLDIPTKEFTYIGYCEHSQRPTYPNERWLDMIYGLDYGKIFFDKQEPTLKLEATHTRSKWFMMDQLPSNIWSAAINCILHFNIYNNNKPKSV